MKKFVDLMIVTLYIVFSFLPIFFGLVALFAVVHSQNWDAVTAMALALVSLTISLVIAKQYQL